MRVLLEFGVAAYLVYFVWLLLLCRRAQHTPEKSAGTPSEIPGKVIPFRPRATAVQSIAQRNFQIR